jgi:MFS-type transporter involved in bile tolerance (Atg22 family)
MRRLIASVFFLIAGFLAQRLTSGTSAVIAGLVLMVLIVVSIPLVLREHADDGPSDAARR